MIYIGIRIHKLKMSKVSSSMSMKHRLFAMRVYWSLTQYCKMSWISRDFDIWVSLISRFLVRNITASVLKVSMEYRFLATRTGLRQCCTMSWILRDFDIWISLISLTIASATYHRRATVSVIVLSLLQDGDEWWSNISFEMTK